MCSSTHVREPAQGLDGICWQLICMSRSLLVLMQCRALMLGVSVSMHDVSSSNCSHQQCVAAGCWRQHPVSGGGSHHQVSQQRCLCPA